MAAPRKRKDKGLGHDRKQLGVSTSRDVSPTRSQLLALREQIDVAVVGMEMLESKRDALLVEFMEVMDSTLTLSGELARVLVGAQYSLEIARSIDGESVVHSAALASRGEILMDMDGYKVMGVAVPIITPGEERWRSAFTRGYAPTGVSTRVDAAAEKFESTIRTIMRYAEQETRLRRLGDEIAKTNRRVNALEQIRIPELEDQVRFIEQTLDERSREELFRLKKVKKNISKRKSAQASA
jgi:V/A-type H+-transporting ATPase subunit D